MIQNNAKWSKQKETQLLVSVACKSLLLMLGGIAVLSSFSAVACSIRSWNLRLKAPTRIPKTSWACTLWLTAHRGQEKHVTWAQRCDAKFFISGSFHQDLRVSASHVFQHFLGVFQRTGCQNFYLHVSCHQDPETRQHGELTSATGHGASNKTKSAGFLNLFPH